MPQKTEMLEKLHDIFNIKNFVVVLMSFVQDEQQICTYFMLTWSLDVFILGSKDAEIFFKYLYIADQLNK